MMFLATLAVEVRLVGAASCLIEASRIASSSDSAVRSRTWRILLGVAAEVDEQGGVAAVVEDEVGRAAVVPLQDAVRVVPVFLERLALLGEDGRALDGEGGGGMVLRREDVAARPANLGAQGLQRLDEHGRLDGHVQAAGDARPLERLLGAYLRRMAMRPGISCSAMAISLRPQSARRQVGHDVVMARPCALAFRDGGFGCEHRHRLVLHVRPCDRPVCHEREASLRVREGQSHEPFLTPT